RPTIIALRATVITVAEISTGAAFLTGSRTVAAVAAVKIFLALRSVVFLGLGRGFARAIAALQLMDERGHDVVGRETFFGQTLDETILFRKFAAGEQRAELVEEHIFARRFDFVFGRDAAAFDADVREAFDVADLKQLAARHQRNRLAALACAPGAPDAVDVIFHVV